MDSIKQIIGCVIKESTSHAVCRKAGYLQAIKGNSIMSELNYKPICTPINEVPRKKYFDK